MVEKPKRDRRFDGMATVMRKHGRSFQGLQALTSVLLSTAEGMEYVEYTLARHVGTRAARNTLRYLAAQANSPGMTRRQGTTEMPTKKFKYGTDRCGHCGHWAGDDEVPFRIYTAERAAWLEEAARQLAEQQGDDDSWVDWMAEGKRLKKEKQ